MQELKRKPGRPVQFPDKLAHRREYMREWRAKRKLADAARLAELAKGGGDGK